MVRTSQSQKAYLPTPTRTAEKNVIARLVSSLVQLAVSSQSNFIFFPSDPSSREDLEGRRGVLVGETDDPDGSIKGLSRDRIGGEKRDGDDRD
jgi:hypothetical protein